MSTSSALASIPVVGTVASSLLGSNAASNGAAQQVTQENNAIANQQGATNNITQNLATQTGLSQNAINNALTNGQTALNTGATNSLGALNTAYGQSTGAINTNLANSVGAQSPYTTAGASAESALASGLGVGANTGQSNYGSLNPNFTTAQLNSYLDPGYQFQLQQGDAALQRYEAANGTAISGQAAKDLDTFNQNQALTGSQNAYNRYLTNINTQVGNLQNLAGTGQSAANQVSGAYSNAGNSLASLAANNGTNQANINTGLGTNLANLGTTTSGQLSQNALGNAQLYGNAVQTGAGNINNLYTGIGNAQSAGTVGSTTELQQGLTNLATPTTISSLGSVLGSLGLGGTSAGAAAGAGAASGAASIDAGASASDLALLAAAG